MTRDDDPFPSLDSFGTSSGGFSGNAGGAASGGSSWGDSDSSVWDPSQARRGYTAHLPALSDLEMARRAQTPLDARRDAALDLPLSALSRQRPGGMSGLSPAALALTARAETTDYLTVSYDQREPGFVELYDALITPQWSVPFGRLLLSLFLTLPRDRGWMALDVACGCGYPTLELARYLGQDCDLGGIDIWEEAILLARRKANDDWLRNVTFLTADVTDSGLPDGTLDTITCNLGLPSFADPPAALVGICRLLRPGGLLLLTTPLQSTLREFLDIYYLTLRDLKLGEYQRILSQRIAATPTRDAVRRQLEAAGFEVQRMVTEGHTLTFPTPRAFLTSPMIQHLYLTEWRDIIPDLTIRRLVFNEVERRLGARAEANGGELAMTVPMLCVSAVRA
ncbi:MAG TPA: class I SAM-dependent methyltransferase [Ktedonobacterales bacterium]|nr:class I SAM-dependent methyltransferase [Ktedonobacterales bacterium]